MLHCLKNIKFLLIAALLVLSYSLNNANAADSNASVKDYNLTASFVYNLLKNVELPGKKISGSQRVVCTVSANPLDTVPDVLAKIANDKSRQSSMRLVNNVNYKSEDVNQCDVLYIGAFEKARISEILNSIAGKHIVTVSTIRDFVKSGGMVGFVNDDGDSIVMQINTATMKSNNAVIDARLLQVAELFGSVQ